MENKYYTPDISDIRIGYEYEYNTPTGWHKRILEDLHTDRDGNGASELHFYLENNDLRTPYLTQEQIILEGWLAQTCSHPSQGENFEKGVYEIYYHFVTNILRVDRGIHVLFYGKCKSINEFRYICKLLNINNKEQKV